MGSAKDLDSVLRDVEQAEREIVLDPQRKLEILREYARRAKEQGGNRRSYLFVRMFNICNAREHMSDGGTNVTITGGNFGVLNLGEIQGNISANVTALAGQGSEEASLADKIRRITDAISSSTSLDQNEKKEALEIVESLSAQAAAEPNKRSLGVVKSILRSFPGMIASAAGVVEIWNGVEPYLAKFFGI